MRGGPPCGWTTNKSASFFAAASKSLTQHKRKKAPLVGAFLRLVLMLRSKRYRLPAYTDERARWGSAVVRCRWQMKRNRTSGRGRRGQPSAVEGRPMRAPQQGYVRTRFPCQYPTCATTLIDRNRCRSRNPGSQAASGFFSSHFSE